MVHASLKSLGHVEGGVETAVQGLLDAVGPEGTLLMPALSYTHVTAEENTFDVRETPSNVGWLPEYFRRRQGTFRSVHPTHSVSGVGPRVEELFKDHILDTTPCGPHSPFRKLRDCDGQILMLGCGLRPNTSMHAVEELVEPPYLFTDPRVYRLILHDGSVQEKTYRPHDFHGYRQRYDRVGDVLEASGISEGPVLGAKAHVINAPAMWAAAHAAIKKDPFFFVDEKNEV